MLHADGSVHYPFSKFLGYISTNPHTQELTSQSLRLLYRYLTAYRTEPAVRALEGRCLELSEVEALTRLCWRPLEEVERLTDKEILLCCRKDREAVPQNLKDAVEPNSARRRLLNIASYLAFYREHLLEPRILSPQQRETLKEQYDKTCHLLKRQIGGTKQNHHLKIQSLPGSRFLEIIRELVLNPERLFTNASGKPASTLQRDRAMALLACEGLRPGAIGNCVLADFSPRNSHLMVKDNRERRGRQKTGDPVLKLGDSLRANSASETTIKLMPVTTHALNEYIHGERSDVLSRHMQNRSKGFLFLNNRGELIGHRATITSTFRKLSNKLAELGLLNVGDDPYFPDKKKYDFTAYTLRHSSASFYVANKGTSEGTKDTMRLRFGWTNTSDMPNLYANRALSDQANVDLSSFNEALMAEVSAKRENARGVTP